MTDLTDKIVRVEMKIGRKVFGATCYVVEKVGARDYEVEYMYGEKEGQREVVSASLLQNHGMIIA